MAIIFEAADRAAADLLVYVAKDPAAADLWVCKVGPAEAAEGDALWRLVRSKEGATSQIAFVPSRPEADLVIHYVLGRGDAGWRRDSTLKGTL